jgi:hypothetical protein
MFDGYGVFSGDQRQLAMVRFGYKLSWSGSKRLAGREPQLLLQQDDFLS